MGGGLVNGLQIGKYGTQMEVWGEGPKLGMLLDHMFVDFPGVAVVVRTQRGVVTLQTTPIHSFISFMMESNKRLTHITKLIIEIRNTQGIGWLCNTKKKNT